MMACGGAAPTSPPHARAPSAPDTPASLPAVELDQTSLQARLDALTDEALCGETPLVRGRLDGAAPFTAEYPGCPDGGDPFCDTIDVAPPGADVCFVSNDHLRSTARAVATSTSPPAASAWNAWDGRTPPRYLDRIDAHYHLSAAEHALLAEGGLVVLDRTRTRSYAKAFHDVFQQELPLYVSLDPLFHASFRASERVLESLERRELLPSLRRLLGTLRAGLEARRSTWPLEVLTDLDEYLGVAAVLLGPPPVSYAAMSRHGSSEPPASREVAPSLFGRYAEVEALATHPTEGLDTVSLFGRDRVVDFSQLEPRGHYAAGYTYDQMSLSGYFRAMMWLSRTEMNLVSRDCMSSHPGPLAGCRTETPREARAAMALAALVEQTGAARELARFERVYTTFGGKREDVSPSMLVKTMRSANIRFDAPQATEALRVAIGDAHVRTARTHFTLDGVRALPVIATLFGPRIVPDIEPLTATVHGAIEGRQHMGPGTEVGFMLGHDVAEGYLREDLRAFPALGAALQRGRETLRTPPAQSSIYGSWMSAIGALADTPQGQLPSFFGKPAYANRRLESTLVAFGQLRHTFVLLAAQGYDSYGCAIPDAYLEPNVTALRALITHADNVASVSGLALRGLRGTLRTLLRIAEHELAGAPMSEADRRFLSMVSEYVPSGGYIDSGAPPRWTGWYYDMFEDREHGATKNTAFVADYFTLTNGEPSVQVLGSSGPRLGVFVVDVNGEPRAMVGPVADAYAASVPLDRGRPSDAHPPTEDLRHAPWRRHYTAIEKPKPSLAIRAIGCDTGHGIEARYAVLAGRSLGSVELGLLDHHGDPLGHPLRFEADTRLRVAAFELPRSFVTASQDDVFMPMPQPVANVKPGSTRAVHLTVEGYELRHAASDSVWREQPSVMPSMGVGEYEGE